MNRLVELSIWDAQIHWPEAEVWLGQSVDTDFREEQLKVIQGRVFAGMNTLWKLEGDYGETLAWCTTMVYTSDGLHSVVQIHVATAKDLELMTEKLGEFEAWAHARKIDYIEVIGRYGWIRKLKDLDFEHNYTSLLRRVFQELH